MEPEHIRASDAERDRVAKRLGDALAEGRLAQEEHAERLDALYRAKTMGELIPLVRDLPAESASHDERDLRTEKGMPDISSEEARQLAATSQGRENIVAVFGGAERKGRWLVEPRTNVSVLFGGVELDLRDAVMAQREVIVQCAVIFGGLEIVVPHGVRVVNNTTAIFGGTDTNRTDSVIGPNAPTVRITGTCLFGGIEAKAKAPKRKKRRN
ncbi:DUF1707 SHOCT-like domain-containing protein [Salinactinospora qingdaonensis]